MNGRWVAAGLVGGSVVFAAGLWAFGLHVAAQVDEAASVQGVPRLTRDQAAQRAARDDMFGLPSRLPNPPRREIERAWAEGTPEHPFPVSAEGVQALFDVYAVSVKGCRPQLTSPEKDEAELPIYVTIRTIDGYGRVVSVDGLGEGVRTQSFTRCLLGGVEPAFFDVPQGGEVTLLHPLGPSG